LEFEIWNFRAMHGDGHNCNRVTKLYSLHHSISLLIKENKKRWWSISSARLNFLRNLHLRPINLIVYQGSMKPYLEACFPLRCFQRLSQPNIATQRCSWRNSWYTRGLFNPVLSSYLIHDFAWYRLYLHPAPWIKLQKINSKHFHRSFQLFSLY